MLRPPTADDREALTSGRDEQFQQFMGPGSDDPQPTFCIALDDQVVGWVDHDFGHDWLDPHETDVGYHLHPDARGRGLATRAVLLLLHHLSLTSAARTATLAIDFDNRWSRALAERAGFVRHADLPNSTFWKKAVPPAVYTDGVVTIRPPTVADTDRHLDATDDVQIRWLWPDEHKRDWATKSAAEQRDHQHGFLARTAATWGRGAKFWFVVDVGGRYVGHVDVDLANDDVPHGEANLSYSCHPDERGKGYISRAARLALQFVTEHSGAREVHVVVHPDNEASLRVARAIGATEVGRADMVRHVLRLR